VFIGHFAVGFAAKRLAPKASLGPLLAAPLLADLLWPVFLLLGIEQVEINAPRDRIGRFAWWGLADRHRTVTGGG